MDELVIKFCGQYPLDYVKIDILNDSNFIFKNDPLYDSVKLFDWENNTVTVNSFIECEHYVLGGWDYDYIVETEYLLQNTFFGLFIFMGAVFWYFNYKKMKKIEK